MSSEERIPPDFTNVPKLYEKGITLTDHPLVSHIQKAIDLAEKEEGSLPKEVLQIDGMTTSKGRLFLNHICSLPKAVYLEVGSWKGASLVSALYKNSQMRKAYAIEKFVRFDANGFDFGDVRKDFYTNVKTHAADAPLVIHEEDCFSLSPSKIEEKVTIYFYDGEHREEDQKEAFLHYHENLADEFIAIVDDWNWDSSRKGTFDAFDQLGYQVLGQYYLPANYVGDKENYWNGIYVAAIRKS